MTSSRQALGRWGETIAANFLDNKGYIVVERNLRTPYGEIDLIAQNGAILVLIEDKIRSTFTYGSPEVSMSQQKREHIISAAQAYLHTISTQPPTCILISLLFGN